MKNKPLYHKTVDILVQAYFDDTLVSGHQCGCAVGNLVAANMGIRLIKNDVETVLPEHFQGNDLTNLDKTLFNTGLWYDAISFGKVNDDYITDDISKQVAST